MFGKNKKKKKKKLPREQFVSLTANGVPIQAINFTLTKNADGTPRLEVRTKDVQEAMHYDRVDFEMKTNLKLLKVGAAFQEARNEKLFKVYVFSVESYEQFFI